MTTCGSFYCLSGCFSSSRSKRLTKREFLYRKIPKEPKDDSDGKLSSFRLQKTLTLPYKKCLGQGIKLHIEAVKIRLLDENDDENV